MTSRRPFLRAASLVFACATPSRPAHRHQPRTLARLGGRWPAAARRDTSVSGAAGFATEQPSGARPKCRRTPLGAQRGRRRAGPLDGVGQLCPRSRRPVAAGLQRRPAWARDRIADRCTDRRQRHAGLAIDVRRRHPRAHLPPDHTLGSRPLYAWLLFVQRAGQYAGHTKGLGRSWRQRNSIPCRRAGHLR